MSTPVTPPCCFTSHRIVHKLIIYPMTPPTPRHPLTWIFKALCQNPLGARDFLGHEPPFSLHGPTVNISLLQTLSFQFAWSHCVSRT